MHILTKSILKEIIPNYLIGVGFLSAILLIAEIFRLVKLAVEKNVAIGTVLKLLVLYLPIILQLTLPIAVIVGTLLAMGRLSNDNEITAMRSCGLSLKKVFLAYINFGIIITILTLVFYEFIVPVTTKEYVKVTVKMFQINPTAELSKSLSYNTIDGIRISVDSVNSRTNEIFNVRINYVNENKLIFAPRGIILTKDKKKNVFPIVLFNSTMQPGNLIFESSRESNINMKGEYFNEKHNVLQTIYIPDVSDDKFIPGGTRLWSISDFFIKIKAKKFANALSNIQNYNKLKNYRISYENKRKLYDEYIKANKDSKSIEAKKDYEKRIRDLKIAYAKPQLSYKKAKAVIDRIEKRKGEGFNSRDLNEYALHRRLIIAFSALAFALLGAPLGIFSKRSGKSLGLGISIIIIFMYLGLIFLGNYLMNKGILSVIISCWYANIILYILGFILIYRRLQGK